MKPPMRHTAYKVTSTRNAYGDYVAGAKTAIVCHFRNVSNIVTTNGSEAFQSDAMAWFEPDSGIVKNDVLIIDDDGWIVERVIKARKLRDSSVQFIKVDLMKYGVIS
jgi:hypothetical protein